MRARRRASVGTDADPDAGRAVIELIPDRDAARKIPGHLAPFADHPGQAGLDGRGDLIDVVAIQAEPGFQPQRVPGAKAGGCHLRFGQQRIGERGGAGSGQRNLEPVFAGIARARHQAFDTGNRDRCDPHEAQGRGGRSQAYQHGRGLGALQGQQRAIVLDVQIEPVRQAGGDMAEIDVLAAGVDHQEQPVITEIGDHQVVQDPAGLVGQQGVALPAGL